MKIAVLKIVKRIRVQSTRNVKTKDGGDGEGEGGHKSMFLKNKLLLGNSLRENNLRILNTF